MKAELTLEQYRNLRRVYSGAEPNSYCVGRHLVKKGYLTVRSGRFQPTDKRYTDHWVENEILATLTESGPMTKSELVRALKLMTGLGTPEELARTLDYLESKDLIAKSGHYYMEVRE